nr:flagellar biosynthesis protein FlhA [Campylobacter sp.]
MAKRRNILELVVPFLTPIIGSATKSKRLTMVVGLCVMLVIIVTPLPVFALDFVLVISILISILVILTAIYIPKPTDLSTFPTVVLLVTMFRLALNIATTKQILLHGYEGEKAVSELIRAFGNFVVGGNMVVGVIVFCILVLINFMVVTKGSTRVSEVQARFTLDSMPGKQMAIDADLNAGLIDEPTARARRQEIIAEANFYGAMDGSSKFIKGDAIAGIIITIVNIIGGFLIGVFQYDMEMAESARTFTILTIGDGLVSQLPSLVVSTATAIIITRSSKDSDDFAEGAVNQLFSDYKVLYMVSLIAFILVFLPGFPRLALGFFALVFFVLAFVIQNIKDGKISIKSADDLSPQAQSTQAGAAPATRPKKSDAEIAKEEQAKIDDILKMEILELDLGYGLLKLADSELIERIRAMRRDIAKSLGFLMPKIRIRDDLTLLPNDYKFKLKGVTIGFGNIYTDKFLAMDSGYVSEGIDGIPTKEPAFGLDALWIDQNAKEDAILAGYTVVEPAGVISTHMSELVKQNASELLTKQEVQNLLDKLKSEYPVVVEETLRIANVGLIQKVLKALLKDNIPIKDMLTILDAVSEVAEISKDVDMITEHVRAALSRVITAMYSDDKGQLKFYILDSAAQQKLTEAVSYKDGKYRLLINVAQTSAIVSALKKQREARSISETDGDMVVCVDPSIRKFISDVCQNFALGIVVLSFAEIAKDASFETLGIIDIPEL